MRRRRARFALDVKTLIVMLLAIIVVEALFFSAGWLIGAFAGTPTAALVGSTEPSIPSTRALDASAARLSLASSVPSFSFPMSAATRREQPVRPNVESFTIEERPDLLPPAPVPPPTAAPPPPAPSFSIAGRDALTYESLIQAAAIKHGLSPMLIAAVTRVESDFDPRDLSNKGARGLMQVMPETGARFGITPDRLFDPAPNIAAGSAYLAWLLDHYRGDLDLALAGYNAGEGAVDQYGGIPPYRETRDYVKRVRAVLARMETARVP
jgi:soluble lytic murein transglycosylase-like protein